MTTQTQTQAQTRATAAARMVRTGRRTGEPARRPGAPQAADQATLTCTWVTADDGALVMQWTGQTPEAGREQTPQAAA